MAATSLQPASRSTWHDFVRNAARNSLEAAMNRRAATSLHKKLVLVAMR